jgi:hypothetical protein
MAVLQRHDQGDQAECTWEMLDKKVILYSLLWMFLYTGLSGL